MTVFDQYEFRRFEPADIPQIKSLNNLALNDVGLTSGRSVEPPDLDKIQQLYVDRGGDFVVVTDGSQIAAMGGFWPLRGEPDTAELMRVRVLPGLQRQGLGQAVLTLLEAEVVEFGFEAVEMNTSVLQTAAQRLYLRNGYAEVRRETIGYSRETIFYRKVIGEL